MPCSKYNLQSERTFKIPNKKKKLMIDDAREDLLEGYRQYLKVLSAFSITQLVD